MALSKLAVRRLTKLAEFMAKLRPTKKKRFDMDLFDCSTAQCAAGWARTLPAFRKAGLARNEGLYETVSFLTDAEDYEHYDELFSSRLINIKTPKQWAKHCRKFIKDNA